MTVTIYIQSTTVKTQNVLIQVRENYADRKHPCRHKAIEIPRQAQASLNSKGRPGALPWVWMGLKKGNLFWYRVSKAEFLRAVTGSGCRSSSSVGGGYFSGRIR